MISAHTEWQATASATAALATATKAAVTGRGNYISGVSASYSAAQIGLLQIKEGAAVIWEGYVHNSRDVEFAHPLKVANATAVSAELAAGAAGVVGKVHIRGALR